MHYQKVHISESAYLAGLLKGLLQTLPWKIKHLTDDQKEALRLDICDMISWAEDQAAHRAAEDRMETYAGL
jgi:hypothetical protein